ncbi:unnamed protein product, partial [Prorocentrum cordatum]
QVLRAHHSRQGVPHKKEMSSHISGWRCPCGEKVPITKWNCKCGTHFNQRIQMVWARRPRSASRAPWQEQALHQPSKAAVNKMIATVRPMSLQEAEVNLTWDPPPLDESKVAAYRAKARSKMETLALSAIAAKAADMDDAKARYEIAMWKAALIALKPIAQQIADMRNRKMRLDDKIRNIKFDQMKMAEEEAAVAAEIDELKAQIDQLVQEEAEQVDDAMQHLMVPVVPQQCFDTTSVKGHGKGVQAAAPAHGGHPVPQGPIVGGIMPEQACQLNGVIQQMESNRQQFTAMRNQMQQMQQYIVGLTTAISDLDRQKVAAERMPVPPSPTASTEASTPGLGVNATATPQGDLGFRMGPITIAPTSLAQAFEEPQQEQIPFEGTLTPISPTQEVKEIESIPGPPRSIAGYQDKFGEPDSAFPMTASEAM